MLRILLAAVGLSVLLSGTAHAQVYAGNNGALVCQSLEPLKVYVELLQDAEAKAKYLRSQYVSRCKQVTKDTEFQLMESDNQFVRLRAKGEFENVYGTTSEWVHLNSSEQVRQKNADQRQQLCHSFGQNIAKNVENVNKKAAGQMSKIGRVPPYVYTCMSAKLTLTKEGNLASTPKLAFSDMCTPMLETVSSKGVDVEVFKTEAIAYVTKIINAAQPFTPLPPEHYKIWKEISMIFHYGPPSRVSCAE